MENRGIELSRGRNCRGWEILEDIFVGTWVLMVVESDAGVVSCKFSADWGSFEFS
jgi:hypothetical protein